MNNDFLNNIKTVLENPEQIEPDQIRALIEETGRYFASLEEMVRSGDEEAKEGAIASALELQRFLESKTASLFPLSGGPLTSEEEALIEKISE